MHKILPWLLFLLPAFAQAQELYEAVVGAFGRISGLEDPETVDALIGLGTSLSAMGDASPLISQVGQLRGI